MNISHTQDMSNTFVGYSYGILLTYIIILYSLDVFNFLLQRLKVVIVMEDFY